MSAIDDAKDDAPLSAKSLAREMADCGPRVVAHLMRIGANEEDAKEAVQITCLRVRAGGRKRKAGSRQSRLGFYLSAAESSWLNLRRARARRRENKRELSDEEEDRYEPKIDSSRTPDRELAGVEEEATTYEAMRERVAGDEECLALLALAREDVSTPSEVEARLGWPRRKTEAVQKRLRYALAPLLEKRRKEKRS